MLNVYIKIKDKSSLYFQLPNDKTKKLWRYIESFYRKNSLVAVSVIFKDGKTDRKLKANRKNLVRAVNKVKEVTVLNTLDSQTNKRSVVIKVCDCETQFVCKCGG